MTMPKGTQLYTIKSFQCRQILSQCLAASHLFISQWPHTVMIRVGERLKAIHHITRLLLLKSNLLPTATSNSLEYFLGISCPDDLISNWAEV